MAILTTYAFLKENVTLKKGGQMWIELCIALMYVYLFLLCNFCKNTKKCMRFQCPSQIYLGLLWGKRRGGSTGILSLE